MKNKGSCPLQFGVGAFWGLLVGSLLAWSIVALIGMMVGSQGWSWPDGVVARYRLQSVLQASLIGVGLAVAGVTYQAILRNPLADPYLLGVSSGASLASYVWRFPVFANVAILSGAVSQQIFAFGGGLASVGVVFLLARRRGRLEPVSLLLMGAIVNAICGAMFLLLNALRPELVGQGGGVIGFLVGGIQTNAQTSQVVSVAIVCLIGTVSLMAMGALLNATQLDEAETQAMGVSVEKVRWLGLGIASLMTASVVAISGPIGFVGLLCPHIARRIVGSDVRRLLPVSAAMGAGLLVLADAISRWSIEVMRVWPPVGVLTSLLGGPFFLYLFYRGGEERRWDRK